MKPVTVVVAVAMTIAVVTAKSSSTNKNAIHPQPRPTTVGVVTFSSQNPIRVGVVGAGGRMGATVCDAVVADPQLVLVAAVDPMHAGKECHGLTISGELKALADDGRLVVIALLGGVKATLGMGDILRRRLTITGSTLRPRPIEFKGRVAASLRERIWPLLESGKIKPVIYKTFPLGDAAGAHALMESSEHIGKIVLTI